MLLLAYNKKFCENLQGVKVPLLTAKEIWRVLDCTFLESEAMRLSSFQTMKIESRETLWKFAPHLKKAAQGFTLTKTYIKCTFLDKAEEIADIEVVLEHRSDELDLIVFVEIAQDIFTTRANKVPGRE